MADDILPLGAERGPTPKRASLAEEQLDRVDRFRGLEDRVQEPLEHLIGVALPASRVGDAIESGRKPGMPLSILSNIAREAPLGSLLVAFLLGVAVARRR